MSANFLDKSGLAQGFDLHTFFTIGPLGVPLPVPRAPHGAGSGHFAPSKLWRIAHSVTTDNWATLQSGWGMLLVPHIPMIPAPPHPAAEIVNIAAIILTSSAAPVMSVHSVTGEGTALCTALVGCGGLNRDCGDPPSASLDFNLNSVKTSPTLGDYLAALLSAVLSSLYSWGTGKLVGNIKDPDRAFYEVIAQALANVDVAIVQTALDAINSMCCINDPVAIFIGWVAGLVQRAADSPGKS